MDRLPAGQQVRFQVRDHDLGRGSSWTVQTHRTKGDVYVLYREGARWIKSSFHESGQWHYSVMPDGQAMLAEDVPAYLGVTHERPKIAPGWSHAMRITVAKSELRRDWTESVKDKQVVAVPPHPNANAVSIDLLLQEHQHTRLSMYDSLLIARMARGAGGEAWVLARPHTLTRPVGTRLAVEIAQARRDLQVQGWDMQTPTRIVIIGMDPEEGYQHSVEVAIDSTGAP
jgi:hypothetical protein